MESASDRSREDDLQRHRSPLAGDAARIPAVRQPSRRRGSVVPSRNSLSASSTTRGARNPYSDSPRLVTANAGDHALVHALLRAVQQAPSPEDFATWLDEPSYEPSDRLLVKRGDQIVGHVQVLHRGAWFHGIQLPVGAVQDLATLPEYRQFGYDRLLLCAAEQTMRDNQAIVSVVRTDRPELFRTCGWSDVLAQGYSQANVGDILSYLSAQVTAKRRVQHRRRARPLRIRLWRHVELDAVRSVYRAAATQLWGAWQRSEPYWHWLVGRRAHSELILAIDGPDNVGDVTAESNIVGYTVMHGSRVVELCCLPGYGRAAPRLLARACRDAIEQDYHTLSLHTSPFDPLHELIVTAGGSWCADHRGSGGTLLVKLLDPFRWIEAMYLQIRRRAKSAELERPCEIGFHAGRCKYRFILTHRSSRLVGDAEAPADVRCTPGVFQALLVGNLNAARAREAGLLQVARDDVLDKLAVLFPPALFWQSQFDMLRL